MCYILQVCFLSLSNPACKAHAPFILSSVTSPAPQRYSTLSHKRHGFRKKVIDNKCLFLFSLQLLSEAVLTSKKSEIRYH